ncbi:MAG: cupin domain-containing protein [Pseudomonadota bacterium]
MKQLATLAASLGFDGSPLVGALPNSRPDLPEIGEDLGAAMMTALVPGYDPPDHLFAAIEDEIDAPTETGIRTVHARDADWKKCTDGIWAKVLLDDPVSGRQIKLIRCSAGAVLPAHAHDHDEYVFMIEGEYRSEDGIVRAGDMQISPAGTFHQASTTPKGCLFLVQHA